MKDIALFTDVGVNPGSRRGVGAYLVLPASFLEDSSFPLDSTEITDRIKVRRFEDTSSTKLELQTVLWALQEQRIVSKGRLRVYSDSQCVADLLQRRPRLLAEEFLSRRTKRLLRNASLYRTFYELHDALGFEVIKLEGHTRTRVHDVVQRIFSCVDKRARKALKLWVNELTGAAEAYVGKAHNENWCVYLLRCRNNSLYTGMTNNIEKRLKEHKQGRGSKFVRSWKPFELVKTIPCRTAGEARKLEYSLKRLTRREKIAALELFIEPVA